MITKEQALTRPTEMWHIRATNKDGTPLRVRSNGQCKTWKTRPDDFSLPVKYGLRDHMYITQDNAHEWCLPTHWLVEQHYATGR